MSDPYTTLVDALTAANADEIRSAREKAGLTQVELGERVGTNQQTIDRIERGLAKGSKFMPEIREALGLPILPEPLNKLRERFFPQAGERHFIGSKSRIAERYATHPELPIFSMEDAGNGVWLLSDEPVRFMPRVLSSIDNPEAYGVIVGVDEMSPVLRKGDVALLDPLAGIFEGSEYLLIRATLEGRIACMFRTWMGFERSNGDTGGIIGVRVKSWDPPKTELIDTLLWPAHDVVVARLLAPR